MRTRWLIISCALLSLSGAPSVLAQESGAPTSTSAAPDLVLLNNGGMVRGTISELVPGDYVIIISAGGDTKRFAMAEVKYAGPAAQAPAPSTPPSTRPPTSPPTTPPVRSDAQPVVTVHAPEAHLVLRANEPNIGFHRRAHSARMGGVRGGVAVGYDEMCTAPCEVSMPAGTHLFALSKGDGAPVGTEPVSIPSGSATLHGKYIDRSGLQIAGWIILAASVVAGSVLIYDAFQAEDPDCRTLDCDDETALDVTEFGIGLGVVLGGTLASLIFILQKDGAAIAVTPGVATAPQPTRAELYDPDPALDRLGRFPGLTLTASF